MITAPDILAAASRIAPYVHRTPVLTCQSINRLAGADLYFKCENFQKIGAFKIRGGMNAALQLDPVTLAKGMVTHSSGNHAQAIAFAAQVLQTKAYIVMPRTAPAVKVAAVKGYGAEVIFCEPNQAAREATVEKLIQETGAHFIHPYDDDRVIAGQATCVKELLEDIPHLQKVIAPVGGGGLLSGTALGAAYFGHGIDVYAGEPEGAADAKLSFASSQVEKAPYVKTIADGLLTTLSERTLAIIRGGVKEILLVSDEEIKSALRLVYERMKIIVEPSCVVPLAAILRYPDRFAGSATGIILTGGNIDLSKLAEWFALPNSSSL